VAPVAKEKVSRFGVIGYKKRFKFNNVTVYEVSELREKPSSNEAPSNLAIVGRYILSDHSLNYLEHAPIIEGELSETDSFKAMIDDGYKVYAVDLGDRRWYDVGSVEGYIKAFLDIAFSRDDKLKNELVSWIRENFKFVFD